MQRANGERNTVYACAPALWPCVRVFARAKERCAEMFSPGQRGVTLGIQSKLSPPSFSLPFPSFLFPLSSSCLTACLLTYLPTYLLALRVLSSVSFSSFLIYFFVLASSEIFPFFHAKRGAYIPSVLRATLHLPLPCSSSSIRGIRQTVSIYLHTRETAT